MGAFNGSGTFVRTYNWVTDKTNLVNITASRMDTEDDGFATGLTLCVTRDGQGKMAADFLPASDNTYNLGTAVVRWASVNGIAYSDFARLSQNNTFTGTVQTLSSATPILVLNDTGAAPDTKMWRQYAGAGFLSYDVRNDANSTGAIWLQVARTAIAVDSINLAATAVKVNGTPINVVSAFKAATTTRASTTTPTSDPDLSISLGAGTWEISGCLLLTAASDGTQGYKAQLNFSSTVANGGLASTWTTGGTTVSTAATYSAPNIALISTAVSIKTATPWDMVTFKGTVTLSVTNTVSVQWSQNTSNVVGTQLLLMSNLIARRIA